MAQSAACLHLAFSFGKRVLALQFHLDVRKENIKEWVQEGDKELIEALYLQGTEKMLAQSGQFEAPEKHMRQIMDNMEAA